MAKVTTKQIIEALKANGGMVYLAARKLNISHQAISKRKKTSPEIQETINSCRNEFLDLAEGQLMLAVKAAKPWAICFVLKCIGKDRGYIERQEVTGKEGGPVTLKVVYENQSSSNGEALA
jgi:hypothetical protein